MRYLLLLFSLLIVVSCNNSARKPSLYKHDSTKVIIKSTLTDSMANDSIPPWCDSLIMEYIKHTHNAMIIVERVDTSIRFEWMLDRKDSNYYVFHIGHDVSDSDGTDLRFVTDAWLYINGIDEKAYEYDDDNDSLMLADIYRKYSPGEFQEYTVNASVDNKVYFYNSPDSTTRRKAFFNTKEFVYVEKIQNGFGYVNFYNTKNQKSSGWMEIKSLIPYPNN